MSLLLSKIEDIDDHPGGGWYGRCPACAEVGKDNASDNLRIWPDDDDSEIPGPYVCAAFIESVEKEEHNKRIYALAGSGKRAALPRIPSNEEIKAKVRQRLLAKAVQDGVTVREEARAYTWDWKAESGPLPKGQRENWQTFLRLRKPQERLWIGGRKETDKTWGFVGELAQKYPDRPPMGADITRAVIWPEWATLRKSAIILGHRWLVVECDSGPWEQQFAVLGFIRSRLGLTLRCVVNSTGKSLHGWFDVPDIPQTNLDLAKAFLVGLGADGQALEQGSTRVPGAFRSPDPDDPSKPSGALQVIVWINQNTQISTL